MKKKFLVLGLIMLIACPTMALGSALEGPGLGARAVSMGGAFIGLADDWTAVYWNPAGLAQLKKPGFGVTLDVPLAEINDGNSVANPALGTANGDQNDLFSNLNAVVGSTEPTQFNKTEKSSTSQLPGIGAYMPIGADCTLAFASYLRLGDSGRWADSVANTNGVGTTSASFNTQTYLSVFNVSLAKDFAKTFYLGAGLNFLYMESDAHAQKTVTGAGAYTYQTDMRSDGNGYEGVVGALYKPSDKFSIGGVYRTGSQIHLAGRSSATLSNGVLPNEDTDFNRLFNHPSSCGVGLAFKPSKTLTFTADWQRTNWAEMHDDRNYVNGSGNALKTTNKSMGWKNASFYRVGAEYKPFEEGLALRLGYFYDESPMPNKAVSITNLVEVDRHACTAGIGYDTEKTRIALTYLYTWGAETINNVNYEKAVHSIQTSFVYWF